MAELKYFTAIRDALAEEMRRDASTLLMGEDVGAPGGIYAQTRGLQDEFGADRVMDTAAGEIGFMGAAVGCALTGMRPIVEISFADFFPVCMDPLVNQAAKFRYMSGGQASVPLTVMSFGGGGMNAGPQHSGTYEAVFGAVPGLKVVTPATPGDAKGLLKTAIRDDDPVIVLFHKGLLGMREEVADDPEALIPMGQAAVRREGDAITIVAWAGGVGRALKAADALAKDGIEAEVIDLRSIQPLDVATVVDSVRRTHRLLTVQETIGFSGIGAEVCAEVSRFAFDYLDAPPERVVPAFSPVPFSPALEGLHLPDVDRIVNQAQEMVVQMSIDVEDRDAIRTITINRPEKRNSLNAEMLLAIRDAAVEAGERDDVRVVVIRGDETAFSTGADLNAYAGFGALEARASNERTWIAAFDALEALDKPVIASVAGFAVAGGTELLLACDLVVAADDATFGLVEARVGVIPGAGASVRLTRWVGRAQAKELLMLGDTLDRRRGPPDRPREPARAGGRACRRDARVRPQARVAQPARPGGRQARGQRRRRDDAAPRHAVRAAGVRAAVRLAGPEGGHGRLPREAPPAVHRNLIPTTYAQETST